MSREAVFLAPMFPHGQALPGLTVSPAVSFMCQDAILGQPLASTKNIFHHEDTKSTKKKEMKNKKQG
jgi:hypothetical protein